MMRSGCGYGRGCSKTASTTVKMAVLAPMPIAMAARATAVTARLRRIVRRAYFRSARNVSIGFLDDSSPTFVRGIPGQPRRAALLSPGRALLVRRLSGRLRRRRDPLRHFLDRALQLRIDALRELRRIVVDGNVGIDAVPFGEPR